MEDKSSLNLSSILNETSEEDLDKETKASGKNFFFSIIVIILIYVFAIYFNEIKSFYNQILTEYILTEKEKPKNKIYKDDNYLEKIEKNASNKQIIIQNSEKIEESSETNEKELVQSLVKKIENKLIEENKNIKIENENIKTELKLIQEELKEVEVNENTTILVSEKEVEVLPIENSKESFIKMFKTDNFKVLQCDGYRVNKYLLNNTCKSKLESFLNDNKDALRFEVITLLGKNDIKSYLKYKAYLEEILMLGISSRRISEMILNMKEYLSEDSIITSGNGYMKSEENRSSVIVKAYY